MKASAWALLTSPSPSLPALRTLHLDAQSPHASSQAHRSDEGQLVHRPLFNVAIHASQTKCLREFIDFFTWSQGLLLDILGCGLLGCGLLRQNFSFSSVNIAYCRANSHIGLRAPCRALPRPSCTPHRRSSRRSCRRARLTGNGVNRLAFPIHRSETRRSGRSAPTGSQGNLLALDLMVRMPIFCQACCAGSVSHDRQPFGSARVGTDCPTTHMALRSLRRGSMSWLTSKYSSTSFMCFVPSSISSSE
mmetsp:Transcript_35295/g.114321  ORF Transcript_35295/g.114321 Transcript_35295/m.114321 type:complete len:248 (+) Transcript_35295:242-985(+)